MTRDLLIGLPRTVQRGRSGAEGKRRVSRGANLPSEEVPNGGAGGASKDGGSARRDRAREDCGRRGGVFSD